MIRTIVTLYSQGDSIGTVHKKTGAGIHTVKKYLKEAGVPIRTEFRKKYSPQILEDYKAGASTEAIRRRYGISRPTLYKLAQDAGVPLHKPQVKRHILDHLLLPVPERLLQILPNIRELPRMHQLQLVQFFNSGTSEAALRTLYHSHLSFS
jgi:DNA invertase Pin-like site-specific DNA recombinase